MTDQIVRLGPEYFPRPTSGIPVSGGSIYIGDPGTDPEIVGNQITVNALQENGSTVPISQPILTSGGGVPLYNGSPVTLLVSESYSLKVLDAFDVQVYYVPSTIVSTDTQDAVVESVEDIIGLIDISSPIDDQTRIVLSFFDGLTKGGGLFYWDSTIDKSTADGGTIVDPDTIGGFDGTTSTLPAYFAAQGTGIGTGCWIRSYDGSINSMWFGSVDDWDGATGTDNYEPFKAAISALELNQELVISGERFATSDHVQLKSNMSVKCLGEIVLTGLTVGGALIAVYNVAGINNVSWVGGTLDGNNITGQNIIGVAGNVAPCSNVVFRGVTVKNALWDAVTFGGKGFTIHQDCDAVRFYDMNVEDCSIGFAVEGFDTEPSIANIIDGVVIKRATRMPVWLVQGGATGLDSSDNFSCIIDNIEINDCDIAATSGYALISCDRATNIQGHFKVSNRGVSTAVILLKGTITNSRLVIDADLNNCQDLIDARSLLNGSPTADSYANVIDIRANIAGSASGYWTRLNPGVTDLTESDITIRAKDFSASPISNSVYSSSLRFDYVRLEDGFRVSGVTNTVPAFDTVARERAYTLSAAVIDELELTFSTGSSVAIIRPYQSTFELDLRNGDDDTIIKTKTPSANQTGISLFYHDGSITKLATVTIGVADSGGVGTRLLRVPN